MRIGPTFSNILRLIVVRMAAFSPLWLLLGPIALSLITACSDSRAHLDYKYQDPTSGQKVELRPSDSKAQEELEQLKIELKNPKVQVLLKEMKIHFWVTKVVDGRSEDIEISGQLDNSLKSWMTDAEPVNGKARMKGYANCLKIEGESQNCSEMFINIYFTHDGKLITRQFIADPAMSAIEAAIVAHATPNINSPVTSKKTTAWVAAQPDNKVAKATDSNAADPVQTPTTQLSPATANPTTDPIVEATVEAIAEPASIENGSGEEESFVNADDGEYVSAAPTENFLSDLQNPVNTPATKTTPPRSEDPNSVLHLNLNDGGKAFRRYFSYNEKINQKIYSRHGAIVGGGVQFPAEGQGFHRVLDDDKAFTTGYALDFFETTFARFTFAHPECGDIAVGNLSELNGGELKFNKCKIVNGRRKCAHASHQNGLEADIGYMPLKNLEPVVSPRSWKVLSNVNLTCNYLFTKYAANLKLDNGEYAVHSIFVHTAMKRAYCKLAKDSHYNQPEDQRTFKTLFATNGEHYDHTHIRLQCSPLHEGCWKQAPLDDPVKCN